MAHKRRNEKTVVEAKSKMSDVNGNQNIKLKSTTPEQKTLKSLAVVLTFVVLVASVYLSLFSEWSINTNQVDKNSVSPKAESKLPTGKIEKVKSKVPYSKPGITSKTDIAIRNELDAAEKLLNQGKTEEARIKFSELLSKYPHSPRAQYGKAVAVDKLAEEKKSNAFLENAMEEYQKVLDLQVEVPKEVYLKAGRRLADRQEFRGWNEKVVKTYRTMTTKYPDDLSLRNQFGVSFLMVGNNKAARAVFLQVLEQDPDNGYAQIHYGFILKTVDDNSKDAIPYMLNGINSGHPGTSDGRFYFHLGDAYMRIGKINESYAIYQQAADKGLFRSKWQRSLYNVDHLKAQPWWTVEESTYKKQIELLQNNWKTIRDEGLAQMDITKGAFLREDEFLLEKGDWKQFTLYQQGRKMTENCKKVPKTCALLEQIPDATTCKRGQIKYSIMQPGVHVWPHCGPTNCRIRAHLGLVIPPGIRIRVQEDTRTWKEGKFTVFDDSFEHEVWHEGDSFRLVLIVDFWHPELTPMERKQLTAI